MQKPETRYVVRTDGVSIAYQVFGQGPMDLLVSPGSASHLDLAWTDPDLTRFLRRLATFARVILYDKPGTGLSDPITRGALGPLESASEAFQRLGAAPALERVRELLDSDAAGPAAARGRVQTASADH